MYKRKFNYINDLALCEFLVLFLRVRFCLGFIWIDKFKIINLLIYLDNFILWWILNYELSFLVISGYDGYIYEIHLL